MKVHWLAMVVLIVLSLGFSAGAQSGTIAREDIVWAGGYWTEPGNWNPLGWDTAWGAHFMYEPLFTVVDGEVVGIIGESIEWIDEYTIEVVIREEATWTDGTPITAHDVIHTFDHLMPSHWQLLGYDERRESSEAISDKVLRIHLKEEFPNSRAVWGALTGETLIVPKHVWEDIEAEHEEFPYEWVYNNDWKEIKPEWQVASGMYLPHDWSYESERLIRNDEWWGKDIWGLPEPKYIGHRYFATNHAANVAFERGDLDWSGFFYPRIWEVEGKRAGEYISTWTMRQPPYFAHSSVVEIVFNHNKYPLSEPWLKHAMAHAIDYDDISMVSVSGYVEQALATRISPQSTEGAELTDEAVLEEYQPSYDLEKAVAILEEHCFQHEGAWYTKDAPEEWRGEPIEDMLPDKPGRNVKLGPWKLMVVYGWTDSMMQAVLFQRDFEELGIRVEPEFLEMGTYTDRFMGMNFELMHFGMGDGGYDSDFHGNYSWNYTGAPGQWENFSAWYHPDHLGEPESAQEFAELLDQLDVTPAGTPEEEEIVSELQGILAREMPSIPVFYNAYWYSFSQMYWHNWPTEENPYVEPLAPWAVGNPGGMQILLRNLRQGAEPIPTDEYPWIPIY